MEWAVHPGRFSHRDTKRLSRTNAWTSVWSLIPPSASAERDRDGALMIAPGQQACARMCARLPICRVLHQPSDPQSNFPLVSRHLTGRLDEDYVYKKCSVVKERGPGPARVSSVRAGAWCLSPCPGVHRHQPKTAGTQETSSKEESMITTVFP